jgi:hypothetical protein
MTEQHWIEKERYRKAFWARCKDIGLDEAAVHELFGTDSMKEYPGTAKDAATVLDAVAIGKGLQLSPAEHTEAVVVVWTRMIDPRGTEITITARQGATTYDVLHTVGALDNALSRLTDKGWAPANSYSQPPPPALKPPAAPNTPAPTLPDGQPDPAWCATHSTAMKRREKDGQVWYSHKVGEDWCRGGKP